MLVVPMVFAAAMTATGQETQPAVATPSASVTQPQVTFSFERKGLPVPKYRLTVQEDGATVYEGEESGSGAAATAHPFRSAVRISPSTAAHVLATARKLDHFNIACASKAKNIADTGTKVLSYAAPDGTGSCTYNYTENKDVQAITDTIQGITETMDRGRELDHLRRFDRLGLDAAITFLTQEVSEGHALELETIATTLHSLVADNAVMERVRARANKLLALIPAEVPQTAP
jgi:hypothetical protein